jgi:hypothetical protein
VKDSADFYVLQVKRCILRQRSSLCSHILTKVYLGVENPQKLHDYPRNELSSQISTLEQR